MGQIFFQPRASAGLFVVVGITVYSPFVAFEVALGTMVSTMVARLSGLRMRDGLQGYGGVLVGTAAWAAVRVFWPATPVTVVEVAVCLAAHRVLERALTLVGLPALAAPLCIVSGLLTTLLRAIGAPMVPDPAPASGATVWLVPGAVLTGEPRMVLVDPRVSRVLILTGLFVAGWRVGVAVLLSSVVGTAATLAFVPTGRTAYGPSGYPPCLTAITVGITLLPPGRRAWVLVVVGSVLIVVADRPFTEIPIPTCTWSFIVTTWSIFVIAK